LLRRQDEGENLGLGFVPEAVLLISELEHVQELGWTPERALPSSAIV
jgi:hypothetical protein